MQSEQINELAAALAKAQGLMENAEKNRTNPFFNSKYADLAAILDAVRVPLSSNGLCHTQTMAIGERCLILRTTLFHASGQFIATEYPIAMELKAQEMGKALTYGRRYSLAALVGIAQDDDDGNLVKDAAPPLIQKPTNGSARISPDELADLREIIDQQGADIPIMCKHFKIAALADITTDKLPEIIAALATRAEREAKKAQPHA